LTLAVAVWWVNHPSAKSSVCWKTVETTPAFRQAFRNRGAMVIAAQSRV
jgi:hypothetical protein